jgi:hypothetical protein
MGAMAVSTTFNAVPTELKMLHGREGRPILT